jgi:hypothetical protein
MFLGRVLHLKELDRMLRRRADNGHQHDGRIRRRRRIDQIAIAIAIDGRGRNISDVAEPVYRRHDRADARHGRAQAAAIAHVAFDDLDPAVFEVSGPPPIAGEHPNAQTSCPQSPHDQRAQSAASASDEDHCRSRDDTAGGGPAAAI